MSTFLLKLNEYYIKHYDGLSRACWFGIAINFIISLLCGVYYFLSLYFVTELHLSIATAGLIISSYGVGAIFGGIAGGQLSDKYSPIRVMSLCLLVQTIIYLALSKSETIPILICNVGVLGFTTYAFLTANHLWVLNQCGKHENERLKAINILSTSANLGLGVAALIISQLLAFGYHFVFSISAAVSLLLSVLLLSNGNLQATTTYEHEANTGCEKSISTNDVKYKISSIYTVLASVFFVGTVVAQFGSTYSIYISDTFPDLNLHAVGILYAVNSFIVVLFGVPLGGMIKQFNKLFMVGVGGLFLGIGLMILNISYVFPMAMFACVIYTIGEIIFFSMAQLVCYQSGHVRKKGRSLGIYRTTYALSRFIGPIAGSYLYLHFGGDMVWYVAGLVGLSCFMICSYVS